MPTYADAKAVCLAVSATQFVLPEYTGDIDDLTYLKSYVLDEVTTRYGVLESVFDTCTIYSTSILRDYVHRAVKQCRTYQSSWAGTTNVTVAIASPAVVTWAGHGFSAGQMIAFKTTGALPTGMSANKTYYVLAADLATDTFKFSETPGGPAVNTSGTQSGTHSAWTVTHRWEFELFDAGVELTLQNADVGFCFRYPATGFCGTVAYQLRQVYRAFGYDVREISGISGPRFINYPGSHVFVEVKVDDGGFDLATPSYVIQDSYFNYMMSTGSIPCNYTVFRDTIRASGSVAGLNFPVFIDYQRWELEGVSYTAIPTQDKNLFVSTPDSPSNAPGIIAIPYTIGDFEAGTQTLAFYTIYPDPTEAYDADSHQGARFATRDVATQYIQEGVQAGKNWLAIANDMRDEGYYVAGISERAGAQRKYLQVRLADGSYNLINVATSEHYDQPLEYKWAVDGEFQTASHVLAANGTLYTGLAPTIAAETPITTPPVIDAPLFSKRGSEIWRDYTTAGVNIRGTEWSPPKADIRKWAAAVENSVLLPTLDGAAIASAATVDLTLAGGITDISGTATISTVIVPEGQTRTVRFQGACTLDAGASLVLPGGADIVTIAGDFATFRGYAGGVVRLIDYQANAVFQTAIGSVVGGSWFGFGQLFFQFVTTTVTDSYVTKSFPKTFTQLLRVMADMQGLAVAAAPAITTNATNSGVDVKTTTAASGGTCVITAIGLGPLS